LADFQTELVGIRLIGMKPYLALIHTAIVNQSKRISCVKR
jgi:hypothetical protein